MPSTMIHLLVAHEVCPDEPGPYWVAGFAPDYTNDRQLKDEIHLRGVPDRWAALRELERRIDKNSPFELGWLLHLFTDACWDESFLIDFIRNYERENPGEHWFMPYRQEITLESYFLHHHTPWAESVWSLVRDADLSGVDTKLPAPLPEIQGYRDRVLRRHAESSPDSVPNVYGEKELRDFAIATARRFSEWL